MSSNHKDIVLANTHTVVFREYADSAARLSDGTLVAGDVNKIVKQTNNSSYHIVLTESPSPTFEEISTSGPISGCARILTINNIGSTLLDQDLDLDNDGYWVNITLTGDINIDFQDLVDTTAAQQIQMRITQDGPGSRLLTFDNAGRNNIVWPGSVEPVLSTGGGDIDYLSWVWDGSQFIFNNAIFDLQN